MKIATPVLLSLVTSCFLLSGVQAHAVKWETGPTEPAAPMAPPEQVPVKINIPSEELANLSPEQRADVDQLISQLSTRLYNWAKLDIELPPTAFGDGTQVLGVSDLMKLPGSDEVTRIGQEQRKLTDEQIEQIHQDAIFKVPSAEYPGRFHVWKLSLIFQKGAKEIRATWAKKKAFAMDQLAISIPSRLFGTDPISIRHGLTNMFNGGIEIFSLVIGLQQTKPTYDDPQVAALVEQANLEGRRANPTDREALFLNSDLRRADNTRTVNAALDQAESAWNKVVDQNTDEVIADLRAANTADDVFFQKLADVMTDRKFEFMLAAIGNNAKLDKIGAGFAAAWVRQARALKMIESEEQNFAAEIKTEFNTYYDDILKQHPWRARSSDWRLARTIEHSNQIYQQQVGPFYQNLSEKLKVAGYPKEAAAVSEDISFFREEGRKLAQKLSAETIPARTFNWAFRIWNKDRWKIIKSADGRYSIQKYNVYSTDTTDAVWRWQNIAYRAAWNFQNGLHATLVQNLWYGPMGLKSFGSKEPFAYNWTLNASTTEQLNGAEPSLVPSDKLQGTMLSRMSWARAIGQSMIDDFNQRTRFGFFGKGFERFLLFFPADLGMKIVAPFFIGAVQSGGTLANVAVSSVITATSVVWAPAASLVRWGFDANIVDLSGAKTRILPSLRQVAVVVGSGAETVAAPVGAFIVHPTMAGSAVAYGAAERGIRTGWDNLWRKAIGGLARVPDSDSWIARRTEGPGLDNEYFFAVKPEVVWASVLADLEGQVLTQNNIRLQALIDQPSLNAAEVTQVYTLLFGTGNRGGWALASLENDRAKWTKELDKLVAARREKILKNLEIPQRAFEHVRVASADFESLIPRTAELLQIYLEKNLFPLMKDADVRAYWLNQKIQPGDWVTLARQKITERLGHNALEPLDGTGDNLVIQISRPDFEAQIAALLNDELPSDFKVTGAITTPEASRPQVNYTADARGLLTRSCESILISPHQDYVLGR